MVAAQSRYQWFAFTMPFTFLLFFIASIAELNRGPFDLPESESELVAGYGTEYSGMRFGMFFLNEYAGMTIMSMVTVTLFLGGWQGPFANALVIHGVALVPIVWFLVKVYVLVFALVWIRLSVPRLQVDQLMGFAWKVLIPLGLVNILATAAVLLWAPHWKVAMAVYSWIVADRLRRSVRHGAALASQAAAPAPGGAHLMLGILKAMRTTLGHLPQRKITVQYPEQREQLPERSRGLFRVVIDPATDDPRCRCLHAVRDATARCRSSA